MRMKSAKVIIEGIKNNFPVVSRSNLDAAVSILDELGRTKDADALIDFAKNNGSDEFWTSDDPFHRRVKDDRIHRIVETQKEKRRSRSLISKMICCQQRKT